MSKKERPVFLWCALCQLVFCPAGQTVWHTIADGRMYNILRKAKARGDKIIASCCFRCKSLQEGRPKGWKPEGWK